MVGMDARILKIARFNQIKKMMERTFSEHDAEALTAIRMVNKWLAEEGLTWERILNRTVTVISEFEEDPEQVPHQRGGDQRTRAPANDTERAATARLLDEAEAVARGSRADFVASVREQFEQKGWISPKQRAALESIG